MKKIFIGSCIIILLSGVFVIIFNKYNEKEQSNLNEVEKFMSEMTIDEKIGQMLVVYYNNSKVDNKFLASIKSHGFGGFILMKDNITTYDDTKKFVDTLKSNSKIPMIISIDQEGGNVQRLNNFSDTSVTKIPYMYEVGLHNDVEYTYNVGKVIAEEVRTIGINVDYAPILDAFTNPNNTVIGKRSFGNTSETVINHAFKIGEGLMDNGVVPVYKHFPGHGDTEVDSHVGLPVINKSLDELMEVELKPFVKAIEKDVPIIMVGHLALPKITGSNVPATLSKKIVTDLLKDKFGYKGLVITDGLNMGALINNYSYDEIYIKSIKAGCDLLLMPGSSKNAIDIIKNNISEERIDESVKKILEFKFKYLKEDNSLGKEYLNSLEHNNIINKYK